MHAALALPANGDLPARQLKLSERPRRIVRQSIQQRLEFGDIERDADGIERALPIEARLKLGLRQVSAVERANVPTPFSGRDLEHELQ